MPSQKRKRQTRLTFETGAAAARSPDQDGPSPARVRYTTAPAPPARASPLKPVSLPRRGGVQTVIGESSTRGMASGSQKSRASASFMPKLSQRPKVVAAESSDEEAAGEGAVERNASSENEDTLPPLADLTALKSSQSVSSRLKQTVLSDDDDDEDQDDEDEAPVPSSARRRKPTVLPLDSDSDDDLVVLSPAKRQRTNRPRARAASSASDADEPPSRRPPNSARRLRAGKAGPQPPSSPSKRPHQDRRTEKQKKMELLRRRRAGEKIDRLTSSESESDDGARRGIYDTDSEEELQALKEFEDDDEEEEEEEAEASPPAASSKKAKKAEKKREKEREKRKKEKEEKKKKKKKAKKSREGAAGSDGEAQDSSDLSSFIASDDDGPLGVPPGLAIPLEFTAQAHKPLKEQFPYVVEWLVHDRVNPAFARDDAVYRNAWRKLNDAYQGLASSKFSSAAWRADFARTLRARPRIDAYEMDAGDDGRFASCEACGRSGHPATWRLVFHGAPYSKETLQEIEADTSSDDSDADGHASVDSQGNSLPAAAKEWAVGSTCKSNAETAHVLLHWKHALRDWVGDHLEQGGWMTPAKLQEREALKPRKRRKLANAIVDRLRDDHVIAALYGDFKANLEDARNKTTRGTGRWQ